MHLNFRYTLPFKIDIKFIVNAATVLFWDDGKAGFKHCKTLLTNMHFILQYIWQQLTINATIIYKHVVILLQVLALFCYPLGSIKQRKIQ
jgi:hypothetical protein